MKKVLLLSLGLVMGLCASAQQAVVAKSAKTAPVKVTLEKKVFSQEAPVESAANFSVRGTQSVVVNEGVDYMVADAMLTTYDMQSQDAVSNRMYQTENGVAVVAMISSDEKGPDFADRGTGYNFSKGGKMYKWGGAPTTRVEANATGEDMRTGWPTIAPWGENGEILVNHAEGLNYWVRETAGKGEWDGPHAIPNPTSSDIEGLGDGMALTWPRIVTTGENNDVLHVFATGATDTSFVQFYLRSEDLEDWTIGFSPLAMDEYHINFYGPDGASVASNGNNIAVVYSGNIYSPAVSNDVMLYESNDAGLTWESRLVWETPIKGLYELDWETDSTTLYTNLYYPTQTSVAIGADGVSHVVMGVGLQTHDELGQVFGVNSGILCDGVAYWNDTITKWETGVVERMEIEIIDSLEVEKTEYITKDTTVVVDSTLVEDVYEYITKDTTVVVDSTVVKVKEYKYDTTYVNDTVPVPSPIRSVRDDSLKNALKLWWDVEGTTTMEMDNRNFYAWMPVPGNDYSQYEHGKIYTGFNAEQGTGDYIAKFGCIAYPSIAVDPAGNIAIAYSAPDVTREWKKTYYLRSLFVNYIPADTAEWSAGKLVLGRNLFEGFDYLDSEATFVSAVSAPVNEGEFWFSCLSDDIPGFHLGSGAQQGSLTTSFVSVFKYNPDGELTDEGEAYGVNETIDVVYNIFPNPASEYICISSSMDANATVTFTNIAGQTVKVVNQNLTTGDNTIVVSDLTSGVYFCTVTANGYNHTSKVVVK